jgi:hypothetical protein
MLYPLHSNGRVRDPVAATCRDVSVGGMALVCSIRPSTKHAYITFEDVPGLAGVAILFQFIRADWHQEQVFITGRYRLDLGPNNS